jgi:hypothetical protein
VVIIFECEILKVVTWRKFEKGIDDEKIAPGREQKMSVDSAKVSREKIFLAASEAGITRAENAGGEWQVTRLLPGVKINCLVSDPLCPGRIYAGTQMDGLLVSEDAGKTWQSAGLSGVPVKSLAVSPHRGDTIYAGCKPVSLFLSRDGGSAWEELEEMRRNRKWWWFSPADPPGWTPYVQALAISPTDPEVMLAGIELGGVLRSQDGGRTWSNHRRGAVLDCHSLKFHQTNGSWAYEGGGGGAAVSMDGGLTWRKPRAGLTRKYGWMVASDPARPEVWYLSASPMPNPFRGEFSPPAHQEGRARAGIFRAVGGAAWELLSGGLPDPLDTMPYALLPDDGYSGHLYAGFSNGEIWQSVNYGDSWNKLPFELGRQLRTMVITG